MFGHFINKLVSKSGCRAHRWHLLQTINTIIDSEEMGVEKVGKDKGKLLMGKNLQVQPKDY